MLAIRIQGLSRWVDAPLEMDGVAHPREASRTLLRIAGITLNPSGDDVQGTVAGLGYVLRDVTLDIEQGSVVCLMDASGSDASVLLQVLSGTIPPTAGRIEIYGPVTTLLSTSDNLDPRLTAYENIRASKAFDGESSAQAAQYAAEVIDFAELQGFEHVPIRTYSTGMMLRLNVALALCGRPFIVLIDDVLRVGDIGFQQKCVERVLALRAAGCTLVLAFGDEALVQQLATRVVTLAGGRIIRDTAAPDAPGTRTDSAEISWQVLQNLPDDDVVGFRSIEVAAVREGDETYLDVRLAVVPKDDGLRCRPGLSVVNETAVLLYRSLFPEFAPAPRPGPLVFAVRVPTGMLPAGRYTLGASMATRQGTRVLSAKANDAVVVTIRREGEPSASDDSPLLQPTLAWDVATVSQGETSVD